MATGRSNNRLAIFQCVRVLLAVTIPAISFFIYFAMEGFLAYYFPETYDPELYWIEAVPTLVGAMIVGLFLGFWRFKSERVGKFMAAMGVFLIVFLTVGILSLFK